MGYQLRDTDREETLSDPDRMDRWARKGCATRFEYTGKPATLVEHAMRALGMCDAEANGWLLDRLHNLDLNPLQKIRAEDYPSSARERVPRYRASSVISGYT